MGRTAIVSLWILASVMAAACDGDAQNNVSGPGRTTGNVQTLIDVTTGVSVTSGETGTFNYVGQSFVVPQAGSFTDVRFNFYTFQKEPVAFGNLFLLTQEYLGVPGALNEATPGFVAESQTTAEGVYTFLSSVTITGGTKYWVYTDAKITFASSFDTDIFPGGDMYLAGAPSNAFRKAPASGRIVNGVPVPPPSGVFVDANFKLEARGSATVTKKDGQ